jgi:hypothetical protein
MTRGPGTDKGRTRAASHRCPRPRKLVPYLDRIWIVPDVASIRFCDGFTRWGEVLSIWGNGTRFTTPNAPRSASQYTRSSSSGTAARPTTKPANRRSPLPPPPSHTSTTLPLFLPSRLPVASPTPFFLLPLTPRSRPVSSSTKLPVFLPYPKPSAFLSRRVFDSFRSGLAKENRVRLSVRARVGSVPSFPCPPLPVRPAWRALPPPPLPRA